MGMLVKVLKGRSAIALIFASAAAAALAGCSSDVSDFSNPFKESTRFGQPDRMATGSIPARRSYAAPAVPVRHVASAPLPAPIVSSPLAPVRPASTESWSHQALAAPPHPSSSFASEPGSAGRGGSVTTAHGVWSAEGGTPVRVGGGESAKILSERYSVPLDVLLRVNGFASVASVRPGLRVIIPVYSAESASRVEPAALPRAPVLARVEPRRESETRHESEPRSTTHLRFVKGPDSLADRRLDERPAHERPQHDVKDIPKKSLAREDDHRGLARDRKTASSTKPGRLASSDRIEADRRQDASTKAEGRGKTKTALSHAKTADAHAGDAHKPSEVESRSAKLDAPAPKRSGLDKTATGSLPPAQTQLASGDATRPDFRWPAHGRVIEGFKAGSNDGINIAVPDGTTVRAVDDGVVAYAGNELKGYGNLVLVRHPNGYVSAYANNGEIDVKRGETVKRGQAIAKSGQSGNVSSPQLHFELRKGQTPVDPAHFLAGL